MKKIEDYLQVFKKLYSIDIEDNTHLGMGFNINSQEFKYCLITYKNDRFFVIITGKTINSNECIELSEEMVKVSHICDTLNKVLNENEQVKCDTCDNIMPEYLLEKGHTLCSKCFDYSGYSLIM